MFKTSTGIHLTSDQFNLLNDAYESDNGLVKFSKTHVKKVLAAEVLVELGYLVPLTWMNGDITRKCFEITAYGKFILDVAYHVKETASFRKLIESWESLSPEVKSQVRDAL